MEYAYRKKVSMPFQEAMEKTKAELAREGFGILIEIDVKETLKKKLDVDFDNYLILGACNPAFAYRALQIDKEVGLFLPCNVIIYECMKNVFISAIRPDAAMGVMKRDKLSVVAEEAGKKLEKAIGRI